MSLTAEEIQATARAAVAALKMAHLNCCLVGSSACFELGNSRVPNDVDVLVLTSSKSPEEIKDLLVSLDSKFYLALPEKNPLATYQVLWYTFPSTGVQKTCRVDVFIPGMISLPFVPPELVTYSPSGLPVMPLLAALRHKVLAWMAHGKAGRQDKQLNDITDIGGLSGIVANKLGTVLSEDISWYPEWFVDASFSGITKYVDVFPDSAGLWFNLWADLEDGMRVTRILSEVRRTAVGG
ncbi:hypothetical protein B0H10DRAFT_1809438 [Mycena sp. CBHHK59/15]|nr:hypothetical protein B0H10DRAFT_1809438 [Mycena sp. CBHHK59/15]